MIASDNERVVFTVSFYFGLIIKVMCIDDCCDMSLANRLIAKSHEIILSPKIFRRIPF